MKSIFLFCTRARVYWVELPILFVMLMAISINGNIDGALKLYPLIIICVGALLFTLIYFFRAIDISYQEIRDIGRFSPRDSAEITEGRTLVLHLCTRGKVEIRLIGIDTLPEYSWMRRDNNETREICMYRGKVWGGERSASKILSFFGMKKDEIDALLSADATESKEYDKVAISASSAEDGSKEIRIRFTETV